MGIAAGLGRLNLKLGTSIILIKMKKAFIQLHLAVFLAGFTAILGKLIQLNEVLLVAYRMALTFIILGAFLYAAKKLPLLKSKEIIRLSLVGFVITSHWVCFYASIKYANVSVALLCFSATSFFTAIFEPLFFRKKLVPVEFLFSLMAILGIYIIFDFNPHYKLGIIFGLLAAIGSALFPIYNKELLKTYKPLVLTFYEMMGGFFLLLLFIPVYLHFFPAKYFYPTPADWLWLVILAVFCTILCFDFQFKALQKISAFTSNLTYNLEPLYGILLAFLIFDESKYLNTGFYLGFILILLSVVLQMFRLLYRRKKGLALG